MTFNPPTLQALGSYWTSHGGVNLGVVGDSAHMAKGTSYHLGKDDLADGAYSARTARDKAGLSNAASAIDLGKLDGSLPKLRAFSGWLVAQARANRPGTADMREIIWSPDGSNVYRWDRERGFASAPVKSVYIDGHWTQGDMSHLTHTHVSFYRDAEARDHRTAFAPYFEPEDDMTGYRAVGEDWHPSVRADASDTPVRPAPDRGAKIVLRFPAGSTIRTIGEFSQGGDSWRIVRLPDGTTGFVIRGDLVPVTAGGDPAVDAPFMAYTQRQDLNEAAKLEGAREEWDRQAAGAKAELLPRP